MRTSVARLYAPFLAVILVQALLVAVAPSRPGQQEDLTAPSGNAGSLTPDARGGSGTGPTGTSPASPDQGGQAGSQSGATPGAAPAGDGSPDGDGGTRTAQGQQGDTSHCTSDGRQHGVTYHAPPCAPKWTGGDNGGATYQGVTDKEIKLVYFSERANPQVNAILESQGLASSPEEQQEYIAAAVEFVNSTYEFYGRKITWEWIEGDCPQTPPDPERCKVAAREAASKNPFAIIWGTPLYPTVFDEWTRAGIVSLGGWHFDEAAFTKRRPYRYDVFMGGTLSANGISEYYCKKLAKKNASHSGPVIHRSIGARDQVPRRLGIIVPDTDTNRATAQTVADQVGQCDGQPPVISTYESDINRAQEQTDATMASMIQNKVTTIVCMCDPIAPAFATEGASRHSYFPEWLMPGLGLLDYDLVGRLYDQRQWVHAFGPSHLANPRPYGEQDHSKVWKAAGREGDPPCTTCGIHWGYINLLAGLIQASGPQLHPVNIEKNVVEAGYSRGGWEQTGHDPTLNMIAFGPGDYTGLQDAREVIWRTDAVSPIDGKPGAYVALDGGRRYEIGRWPASFNVPAPPD